MKMGMSEEDTKRAVLDAVDKVGLDSAILEMSPFELSGGQQRRVAMAGVLAMMPKVLVLDEPAAGLDPAGRKEMFEMISNLKKSGTTIILVTHNMDEAYEHADRICVIKGGKLMAVKNSRELFENPEEIREMEIDFPILIKKLEKIADRLGLDAESKKNLLRATSVSEAAKILGGQNA